MNFRNIPNFSKGFERFKGPFSIILSNICLILALHFVQKSYPNAQGRICYIAVGNLGLTLLFVVPRNVSHRRVIDEWKDYLLVLIWAFSYCLTYGLFSYFPASLHLSHLIIAESVAPLVSVFLSGDWRRKQESLRTTLVYALPLGLLFGIAFGEWKRIDHSQLKVAWGVFGLTCVAFITSQSAARAVSHRRPFQWIGPRLGLFVAILFFSWLMIVCLSLKNLAVPEITYKAPFLTLGILLTTGFYIYGLQKSHPLLSSLMVSAAVPISLVVDHFFSTTPMSYTNIFLSTGYCLCVFGLTIYQSRTQITEDSVKMSL